MRTVLFKLPVLLLAIILSTGARAQDMSMEGTINPVSADDATVVGGVLRTQVLRDTLVRNPETGQMEKLSVVTDFVDVNVEDLGDDPEEALSRAKAVHRAKVRRVSASDEMTYGDYYTSVAFYLYTFNYPSIDKHGNRIILSSLMAFPYFTQSNWDNGYRFNNVIIGCHCTITSNMECPSDYPNGGFFKSNVNMMQYYASWGKGAFRKEQDDPAYYNILIMPDYEGYGVTKTRPHPYLYQELTARQVIDGVRYGLALFKAGKFAKKDKYSQEWAKQYPYCMRYGKFIPIGASQGGSVAMAVHRYIEQNGLESEMPLAGSVCCDGPYDPVATLKYYMKEDKDAGHNAEELTMPVAIALILKGMLDTNPLMIGHKREEYFSEDFLSTNILQIIEDKQNPSKEMTTEDINDHLVKLYKKGKGEDKEYYRKLLTKDGRANMKEVLTDTAYNYFLKLAKDSISAEAPEGRGLMKDLHRALESNNLTKRWQPQKPICLYHSTKDTVVPYVNFESAKAAFSGITTLYLDDTDKKDHIKACTNFMFAALSTSPDIKFIRTLFGWGEEKDRYTANK
ncbi:MAG: hypothetical protein J6Z14_11905 [Prevotella sp.]|nr:hypothetical protein [Prevotella sp.]